MAFLHLKKINVMGSFLAFRQQFGLLKYRTRQAEKREKRNKLDDLVCRQYQLTCYIYFAPYNLTQLSQLSTHYIFKTSFLF